MSYLNKAGRGKKCSWSHREIPAGHSGILKLLREESKKAAGWCG